uniref:Nonribosomal peptide synthetase 2 n=1 Tax=Cochliobolus lunatus TaxID=5503 RepID=A0A1W6BS24_COCLU|nr:nonribosomal peptide synthetase 2 [Curvularia lunata]
MLDNLPGTIVNLDVDAAELTPTVVASLLPRRSIVPCLRLLLTIGEMLTPAVVDEYGGDASKPSLLWAMYGPTEAAIHCTIWPQFSTSFSTSTIGVPLDTVSAFILAPSKEHLMSPSVEILPIGEIGELAIGGPQIADEYLNRTDLTRSSFIEHPHYGRLYRTGDKAKLNEQGILECLGRVVNGQVKLRGQRIELGEIEQAIMKTKCRAATAMIIQENLVAFCSSQDGILHTDVLTACKRWLPAYMVPSDVFLVDAMPQLPSGKIDRKSLEKMYLRSRSGVATSTPNVSSEDPVSHSVWNIVSHHTPQNIELHTSLASVGIDSLRAIRIASALRREGYSLGAIDVLSAATLAELIEACRERKMGDEEISAESSTHTKEAQFNGWHDSVVCMMPCTPLQEAMLAETRSRPTAYCNWIEVELLVVCTYEQIRDALLLLTKETEILRTGFHTESRHTSVFSQIIWKELLTSQIRRVSSFSKEYSLQSDIDFLRPFNVQISTQFQRPRLLFQIHHALYDGWSFDLLLHDLDKCLRGEQMLTRPSFREVVRYLANERRPHSEQDLRNYWNTLLSDHIPATLSNYHGKVIHDSAAHRVSGKSIISPQKLFGCARQLAVNPQVYFQAATAYILGLYSGTSDVVLGNVTSGRTMPVAGVEDIIGPCIASLPFRIDFADTSSVRDILRKTQLINRENLRYGELPLREIARAVNVKPGVRLFETLFVWQQSITSDENASLGAKIVDSADEMEFRITLEFEPAGDHIRFRGTFDASTVSERQVEHLFRQIDEVVRMFLANVELPVTEINQGFTTPSLSIANPMPLGQRFHHGPSYAVEQWAMRDPHRTAIIFGHNVNGAMEVKHQVTYSLLNSRANQLARVLAEHGVGNDQLVCIIMEKSVDLYTSILAVLKLGCGYLPLVPDTPIDRVKTILNDAQVAVCVSESSLSSNIRSDLSVDIIDFDRATLSDYSSQNLDIPYNGEHLAYAIFTSGSTGTPKGVLVTQDNLMSNLQYLSTIYPFSADSRLLQACSQAFDVSVFEIFFSWYVGMCLCSATKEHLFRDFEAAINRLEVTHLSLTPTVAALVDPNNVPKVEFLVTAGEALTEHVRRKWAGRGLYQGYGPSETTNICTVRPAVTPDDLINNIGQPFSNTSAFVLDPESQDILPRGAVGELCFGGSQVFRGYLNRPELNAQKILRHPTYGRLYRSGDMGILLPDDSILSTGRTDDQVKIRGQRVELGETTSVILDHKAVRDSVTLALDQNNKTKTLVSFWVPNTSSSVDFEILEPSQFALTITELFDLLSRRSPSYMVPSHLMPISCLPMTPQAKIDKRLLQRHFSSSGEATLNHCTISNGINETGEGDLLTLWDKNVAEILFRTLDISPDVCKRTSSFFNLGLDSVSAIRFCIEMRKAKLGDFSVSEVLKHPSIADLASLKESRPLTRAPEKSRSIEPSRVFTMDQTRRIVSCIQKNGLSVMKVLPCTPLQEAMISSGLSFSEQAYCNIMIFDVIGDGRQLQKCWEIMVQRHDILRTLFVATEDPSYSFAQVIVEDHDVVWHQHSMESTLQSHIGKTVSGLMEDNKPPVYFGLVQEGNSTKLLFCCHHALYDGIAISTLLAEIQELYCGRQLPPPISYEVYLKHMLDQDLKEADKYWAALLEGFEPTSFPALTAKRVHTNGGFSTSSRRLSMSLEAVQKASRDLSVSLLSLVQAAWAKLLHFYTHESDVCFGNVVSGRTFSGDDLERLVAPCFNTLPVRLDFDFHRSNRALVNLMHSRSIESYSHQLTPLRRIQKTALKEGGRLFDTLLILQQPSPPLDSSIWKLEQDSGDMDVPIVCEIVQDQIENTLGLTLHYHTSLLSETEASIVMDTYSASLRSLIASPDIPSIDTDMFSTELRATSNIDFKRLDSNSRFLHSGFEHMASLHPDRIALDFWHGPGKKTAWSFEQLNREANKIAHALIEIGAGLEQVVPIHISKSPVYYASILGVLKAGAAFAPVHPDLPEARKQFMFAELKPKVVLCDDSTPVSKGHTGATILDVQSLSGYSDFNPVIELKETNLAYCLFTSGSTGTPKAVSMEHNAPIQTIESSRTLVPWKPSSRLLQYAAITFDMCYYDCFLAWTFGFTLCAAEQGDLLNDLAGVINALEADLLDLTPSVAESLKRAEVRKVKWLYCIGEAMSPAVAKEWQGACVNSYGPTEAAFCTTIVPVSRDGSTSVIGKPFPTTSFAVLSEQGETPLPILSIGELYIGGTQLARGYWNRPDLTMDRFVTRCSQRFYKSGDMVRMLSDGNFEFVGRTDDQVKIRGLRVELGEINSVLIDLHQDLATVTTQILRKDQAAKEQLVSFLVMRRQIKESEISELQITLKKLAGTRLPSYMVPQFFLVVDKIPKSMAGKIDKKALNTIFQEHADTNTLTNGVSHATEHHWSKIESDVRKVLAQISKTPAENISPTTSIYQIGLDSISAVQIASVLRDRGYTIKATDVLKYTTCSDLAERLSQTPSLETSSVSQVDFHAFESKHRSQILKYYRLGDQDIVAVRPCTPLQNGMISQFLAKDGAVYMNCLRLQLEPNIDIEKLKAAWSSVMKRQPMLRTGFAHVKDALTSFAMIEYTQDSVMLPWSAAQEQKKFSADTWLAQIRHQALKELHVPPWALRLTQKDGQSFLDLAIFHALFDAQSLRQIFSHIMTSYKGIDMPPVLALDDVVSHIIQSSKQDNRSGDTFWTELGKTANPSRFPNLAPLKYDPEPALVCTRQSAKSLLELKNGCRQANTTIPAVGMASWLSLLSSYTGESSVTCGVVLSGRNSETTAHSNFPCINTVPLAFTVTDDIGKMLESITALNAGIQEHQFSPLKKTQKLMGFPNEALFDTVFAYQQLANDKDDCELWKVIDEKATIEYPVSIELEPKNGQLEYRLTYLPHIIPSEQASLILAQLDHLIERFIFGSEIIRADTGYFEHLYSITPAKEDELPSDAKLLHELVEKTAEKCPQSVAFEFVSNESNGKRSARRWTYAELDHEGNKVANLLLSHHVKPGSLVGVCFDKCPEASFAMLGILKAGCAFVAVDPGAPAARQTFIIDDSGAQAVLSMALQSAQFQKDAKVPVLNLDEVEWRSLSGEKPLQNNKINPLDCSYCLYTSGTTGTPKGCEITHENAVQALMAFQRLFAGHWDANSRWLQFASFHFDVSVLEQYWSWSVGICVVSAPRDLIFEDLASSIRDLNITHIDLTPSLAQILHPDDVPSLCKGVFITGGESLKQEILDVWGPKGVIYNGYGPTEATIGCTMYPRVPANGKPSNIGPQFDNVGSLVLRPGSDIPVLRGGIGELCVSGKLVGKGYLNRPELTAERFPYLDRFSERVYRTGDIVRILHDGTFYFLGRADDQVKLRGQRLEVAEINSVIKQADRDISDVATLVLKHPNQQKEQLVAFLVCGKTSKAQPEVLLGEIQGIASAKQACNDKLPPYMIPTHFVPLTAMPLNINNKADGRKLKQMYEALSASDLQKLSANSGSRDEPWSKQEEKIRNVMLEALDASQGSTTKDTSFFELGMDSISVIGVTRTLKNAGFVKVTASMIMQYPTIRRLAKTLMANSATHNSHGSVFAAQQYVNAVNHRHRRKVVQSLSVEPNMIEALAPCTPLQQGMIARSMESDKGPYFNSFKFKLNMEVDEQKLEDSWKRVHDGTQVLRTVFISTEEGYLQAVLRGVPFAGMIRSSSEDQNLNEHMARLRKHWLSLNEVDFKCPFQAQLLTTPKQKLLIVNIFHGLYDGNSVGLLLQAVWESYHGMELMSSAPSFQTALVHGPLRAADGAREFWEKRIFANATALPTLCDNPEQDAVVISRTTLVPANLDHTRRQLNVTAQAIVQACWLSVLHRHVKGNAATGIVVSGRSIDLDGADRVIGPMFNTIPYHSRAQHCKSWSSMIKTVHEFNVAAHPFQHTPLRDIMKWCKRSPNNPLFDSLFVYQVAQENQEWERNDIWEILEGETIADYPLAFEVEQRHGNELRLMLVAQGHIADAQTAAGLVDQFEEALEQALRDPSAKLELPFNSDDVTEPPVTVPSISTHDHDVTSDFEWTGDAIAIREEIVNLTAIENGDINEKTSIFELGLDSIDAIKLSSKLKKRGVELSVSAIMRSLTIEKMVQNVSTKHSRAGDSSLEFDFGAYKQKLARNIKNQALNDDSIEKVLPLTPLQEAMVAEMIASEYTRYFNHDVLKLDPRTDICKLKEAWRIVVTASPILRTGFVEVDDPDVDLSFAQIIHSQPHEFCLHVNYHSTPDFTSIFEDLRNAAVDEPLSTPPFRLTLIDSPGQCYLVLSIAHALYDGWSLGLLHSDVYRAYCDAFETRPSYEPILAEIVKAPRSDAAGFWQDYLSGAHVSTFSLRTLGRNETGGVVHRCEEDSEVALSDIQSFARKNNVSLQTVGQTVFALVTASFTQSLDVTFGSVLSGRDNEEASQLMFPTMNTVAIRTILHGTSMEMLHYVQDNLANIKQWQHYPLRKALSQAGISGKLFESLFIYQKNLEQDGDEYKTLYTSVEGQNDVEYPVCVEMEVVKGKLVWRCAVKKEVFNVEETKQLLKRMDKVLQYLMKRPEASIMEVTAEGTSICGLPAFEEAEILATNDTAELYGGNKKDGPSTATRDKIREVLAAVSKTSEEEITNDMTIFHIGLDSISAIKVSSLLRKQGIVLSVGEMLQAGSVGKMAKLVDSRTAELSNNDKDKQYDIEETMKSLDKEGILGQAGIDISNVAQILPVTAGQLYMLSMWLNTNGTNFYPEFTYNLVGDVTLENLQESWRALVNANPILRTCFASASEHRVPYIQIVLRDTDTSIIDVTGWREDGIQNGIRQAASCQPWAKLFVSQHSGGWTLRLKIHHALYDGVSLPLLMEQLRSFCNGAAPFAPQDSILGKLVATAYSPSTYQQRRQFWETYINRSSTVHSCSQLSSPPGARIEIFRQGLTPGLFLDTTARQHGVSPHALFLAAYAQASSSDSTDRLILGIYLANRALALANIASTPTPTLNLLPLRITSPNRHSTVDLATTIQRDIQALSAPAIACSSLPEIQQWTGVKVDVFVNFLVDVTESESARGDAPSAKVRSIQNVAQDSQTSRSDVKEIHYGEAVPQELVNHDVNEVFVVCCLPTLTFFPTGITNIGTACD